MIREKYINPFTDFGFKAYHDSLKSYRDLKNVIDTSYKDGKIDTTIAYLLLKCIKTEYQRNR
ncbi:MAG: hypothetical protein RL757_2102 [Bacteroidota bacterium]|jgi:hypothetical protein